MALYICHIHKKLTKCTKIPKRQKKVDENIHVLNSHAIILINNIHQ